MNTLDVRDYLEDGERLLWESKPKPFHIIEGSEGRDLMFVWTVSLFWLYMILIYRLYNGMNTVLAMGDKLLAENGKQLRYRSLHPVRSRDSDGKLFTIGLVFYNAERIDEAARLLEKMSRQ